MPDRDSLRKISQDHLLTLYEITQIINSSLEFDAVLQNVMDSVMQITRAQRGFLMVADDMGQLSIRVARSPEGENLAPSEAYSTTAVNLVLESREAMLTNNTQIDPQLSKSASVMLQGLRAILCAPMLLKEKLVGVVYVDTSLRAGTFVESDLHLLKAVSGQAAIAIENARLYHLAVEKGRLERELQMARQIQLSLLPRVMPEMPGYEVAANWWSAREVAGDFYDVFLTDSETLFAVVADVSDKGAAAALGMASTRSMIRAYAFAGHSPQQALEETNDLLVHDNDSGMFVTAYCSQFSPDGHSIHVNAGHNPPAVYRRRTGSVEFMKRGGRALGWFRNNPLRTDELQLEAGDVMVLFTDGITELENAAGEEFGEARLAEMIARHAHQTAAEILAAIDAAVDAHGMDATQTFERDDLTLCVLRYTGNSS